MAGSLGQAKLQAEGMVTGLLDRANLQAGAFLDRAKLQAGGFAEQVAGVGTQTMPCYRGTDRLGACSKINCEKAKFERISSPISARTQITQDFLGIHEQRRVACKQRRVVREQLPLFQRCSQATLSVGASLASNVR